MIKDRKKVENSILYLPEPGPIRLYMYLRFLKIVKPKKLILTFHGTEVHVFSRRSYRRFLFNGVLYRCNKVSVLSSYVYNLVLQHFPQSEPKLVYTPGALAEGFNPPTVNDDHCSLTFNLLTVARIHPRKGHIDVLKAINALEDKSQTQN